MTDPASLAIWPTSIPQREAWDAGVTGEPELVADGVWAISSPTPISGLPCTLTYVLASSDGSLHVIDPGWGGDVGMEALTRSIERIGYSIGAIQTVVATHFHADHLGLCGALRDEVGAQILLSRTERAVLAQETAQSRAAVTEVQAQLDEWGVPEARRAEFGGAFGNAFGVTDIEPDRLISHGDRLEFGGHTLEIVETPGHTEGHVCLIDHDRQHVYSGDHVLPRIFSGVGLGALPGSDALNDYFTSLVNLATVDEYEVLPGHEYRFRGLAARRREIIHHHLQRTREVADLIPRLGNAPIWEYARQLSWTLTWGGMKGHSLQSALRQTERHKAFVLSGRAEPWLVSDSRSFS